MTALTAIVIGGVGMTAIALVGGVMAWALDHYAWFATGLLGLAAVRWLAP